jgi:hypothetical protein
MLQEENQTLQQQISHVDTTFTKEEEREIDKRSCVHEKLLEDLKNKLNYSFSCAEFAILG